MPIHQTQTSHCFSKRHLGHEYSIEHQGDRWLVLTNDSNDEDGKHDERAVNRSLHGGSHDGNTERNAWTEIIGHREDIHF